MKLVVCSLAEAPALIARLRPAGVVSLLAPGGASPPDVDAVPHLSLALHDIAAPRSGLVAPDAGMMDRLLAFGARFEDATVLVHCWMGISRSPAAAYALACAADPARDEREIARALRTASPTATPNAWLVALADAALGRGGRMSAAIAEIGRGAEAACGAPFELDV